MGIRANYVVKRNHNVTSAWREKHFRNCHRFGKEKTALTRVVTLVNNENGCFIYIFNIQKMLARFQL